MVTEIASDGEEYDRYGIHFQSYKFKIIWHKVMLAYDFFFFFLNETDGYLAFKT